MIRSSLMLALALVLGLSTVAKAEGTDNNFDLINKTGYTLDKVFVSPHGEKSWGEDIMGKETVKDGETVHITFHPDATHDHYDLKVVYDDKEEVFWENLELPKVNKLTIHWDKATQKTSAEAE